MWCVECQAVTAAVPCSECGGEPRVGGRYPLLERVGRGASGVVYRSKDVRTGDPVAIKEMPLGGMDGERARELAFRETELLRQLHHPGIPRWRDELVVGEGRAAALYLVQAFVDGEDLQQSLLSRAWTEHEVLGLMVEVLHILDYLHGCPTPIIHRDVKPANLIRRSDGQLVLVDFGAVRDALRHDGSGGRSVSGTFGYMAPEQFVGQAEPATDLYALGMTAVALLSRDEPMHLHDRAGRLDWNRVATMSPQTLALLQSMLQPDPALRPRSAAVVRHHILKMLDADHDARTDAPIGPTLVPFPAPLFDDTTGVFQPVFDTSTHAGESVDPPTVPPPKKGLLEAVVAATSSVLRGIWGPGAAERGHAGIQVRTHGGST